MATFITGHELNSELGKIFKNANQKIILISPYIKLHDRDVSSLKVKKEYPEIQIIIVFGKNEEDISKSMKEEDFNFFKEFPNIQIRYEKRLHAKYFANEENAILTSMNLYSYSQNNNIEFGVLTKGTFETLDKQAWEYFTEVIDQSKPLFHREPQYEKAMLGLSKKYTESIIKIDKLSEFFQNKNEFQNNKKTFNTEKTVQLGFCIRTGKKIPFNPERPMSDEAYESWVKFKNEDYPEKFCHFSGEKSNGETSFAKPILRKNWKKAQAVWSKLKK